MSIIFRNDSVSGDMILATGAYLLLEYGLTDHVPKYAALLGADRNDLYHVEIATTASILGFLIAAAAILGTADSIQALKREHREAHRNLIRSFTDSMFVSILSTAFFFVAIIADPTPTIPQLAESLVMANIGIVVFGLVLLRVARSVKRLFQSLVI